MSREEAKEQLPLVSVITPSYQQGGFIRETLDSILSQDYPNVELIVVDGGSQDETVDILQKYARKYPDRFRFLSEKDKGQSNALNKGLAMARGEIIGWLNSDDTYWPKAISRAVSELIKHPEYGLVYGKTNYTDKDNKPLRPYPVEKGVDYARLFDVCTICQPAAFIRKRVLDEVGPIDESLHFCMDYDLWIRIAKKYPFGYIDHIMANSRLHDDCKSATQYFTVGLPEIIRTNLKHYGAVSNHWLIQYIAHHLPEGPEWLIDKMKQFRVFGETSRIRSSNKYEDGWAPPYLKIEIENKSEQEEDLFLLIGGDHQMPRFTGKESRLALAVRVNGVPYKEYKVDEGPFKLKIPLRGHLPSYTVEIEASRAFVPAKFKVNSDQRELSFKMTGCAPLAPMEARLYELLDDEPASVGRWLMKQRKFKW